MELAYKIRNKYYPELSGVLNWEKTVYNSDKLKGICERCNKKMGEEIHHKIPQKTSNKKGYLKDGIHKNVAGNLMSLCNECHLLEHNNAK
jgi:5-methylcytosine-specific restriction endonuclease McrA